MAVMALGAVAAGIDAFPRVSDASSAAKTVETWRLVGFFTFAALFALLAAKPKTDKIVWWIVILNKFALTVAGVVLATQYDGIEGVRDLLVVDGVMVVVLLVAYLLSRDSASSR